MAGKGGGAWKVAYADFVTAMMAFFMVMWLTSQKPEVKEALGSYFNDPWARSRINKNQSRSPSMTEHNAGETDPKKPFRGSDPMLEPHDLPEAPESKTPRLKIIRQGKITNSGTVVYFADGGNALDEASRRQLKNLVPSLKGLPNKLEVRGHTGLRANVLATDDEAWIVSYQRALAVVRELVGLGIPERQMRITLAGPHEPLSIDGKAQSDQKNMRVEVFALDETITSLQGSPAERAMQH
jgi:chemotaxis protein MotB